MSEKNPLAGVYLASSDLKQVERMHPDPSEGLLLPGESSAVLVQTDVLGIHFGDGTIRFREVSLSDESFKVVHEEIGIAVLEAGYDQKLGEVVEEKVGRTGLIIVHY